jgi:2-methylisocitrate lyase-like PEP mutase family enzyme
MDPTEQARLAELFRSKHRGPSMLLLPNAWDTTSRGVAWSLDYADGEQAPWSEVVAATARIVHAAKVPVTADIEAGDGETPSAVMGSITEIIRAGAVGVNLEDGTPRGAASIRTVADAADRIRAAREAAGAAGVPIVVNARTDLYLRSIGDEVSRFDEAVERGRAYLAAGADCVYPISLRDPATIGRLVKALWAPININVQAGPHSIAEFEALGVARARTASAVALMALATTRQIADELRASGRFGKLARAMAQADAQRLFVSH